MYNQGSLRSSKRLGSRRGSMSGSMMDLQGPEASGRRCFNKTTRGTLLIFCLILTIIALILIGIGLIAPGWLSLDITEYQQEWQIGLWRYCRRGGSVNEVGRLGIELSTWICDVKNLMPTIDMRTGQVSQFQQNEHNETPVLFFLLAAFLFGLISMFALCCAYCNKYIPYCIIVTNLIAMLCSVIASLIYIISLQDVNSRRYTSFNAVYFGQFGYAFYCTLIGSCMFILSFILTIPVTVLSFAWGRYKTEKHRGESMMDVDPSRKHLMGNTFNNSQPQTFPLNASHLNSQYNTGSQYGGQQPIIVERDADTHSIHSVRRFDEVDDDMRSAIKSAYGQGQPGYQGQGSINRGNPQQQSGSVRQNRSEIVDILNRDPQLQAGTPLFNQQGSANYGNAKQQIAVMEKWAVIDHVQEPYRGTQSPIYGQASQMQAGGGPTMQGYIDVNQPYRDTYMHEQTTTRTESRI